jgi:plasmid stabilization system protein ParE
MRVVAEHPGAGRPVERMDPGFREWLIGFGDSGYVVLYRLDGDKAVVLAVRNQKVTDLEIASVTCHMIYDM